MDTFFQISLAEWSLHRALQSGKLSHLDFPRVAKRDFQIDCVELVDQFFADKSGDTAYLRDLKSRADGEGVKMSLLMIDSTGLLGAAAQTARDEAVAKTIPWLDAAQFLGCGTVRVNAFGDGDAAELRSRVVESCARLADCAAQRSLNLVLENHGQLSSDPAWLLSIIQAVNQPNFGSLPDFGNFPPETDRYQAVEMLMPFAKGVSAKSRAFNAAGEVEETDFRRMLRIVLKAGYHGYVGIESAPAFEAKEPHAIRATRDLLQKIRQEMAV